MQARHYQVDSMAVEVHRDRQAMGAAAAALAAGHIQEMLKEAGEAAVVFASAASQNEFLEALRTHPGLDWTRVTIFHLDEYLGIGDQHPASFRRYLIEHLVSFVPVRRFHQLRGEAPDPEAECARYQDLLRTAQPGLVALGIGENGHLAFIDPAECDFHDPRDVRVVELDDVCRRQQVHDGAFETFDDVPRRALSLTVPAILRAPRIVACVPGPTKKESVKRALEGVIAEECPASALRRHGNARLFLDAESAALLNGGMRS
jgi:glucosamine-6-phosphate deaminase